MVGFPKITAFFESWENELYKGLSNEHSMLKWNTIQKEIKTINRLVKQEIKKMKPFINDSE